MRTLKGRLLIKPICHILGHLEVLHLQIVPDTQAPCPSQGCQRSCLPLPHPLRKGHLVYVRPEELTLGLFEQVLEHKVHAGFVHLNYYDDDTSDESHVLSH